MQAAPYFPELPRGADQRGTLNGMLAKCAAGLLFLLALAGCAGTEPGADALSTPSPQATAAPAAAPQPAAPPPTRAIRDNARPAPTPAAPPVVEEPMTRERASMICWSKYEDGRRKMSLDQRADLVDKCVKATMRGEKAN